MFLVRVTEIVVKVRVTSLGKVPTKTEVHGHICMCVCVCGSEGEECGHMTSLSVPFFHFCRLSDPLGKSKTRLMTTIHDISTKDVILSL